MKKLKKIPKFKSEKQEREFWRKNNSADFIDWQKAEKNPEFPNLKPSTKTISLRLSESMLNNLKMIANEKDIPYQSFIKVILNEKIIEKKRGKQANEMMRFAGTASGLFEEKTVQSIKSKKKK